MPRVTIRMAEEADNDRIIALARRCPQEGMITFFPERSPRFNTLHRLLDPGSWHYVACEGERIVGLVGVIHFPAVLAGRQCRIAYMMDLRVDPEYRSGTTAFRMVRSAIDHVLGSGVDLVIGNFLKNNRRPMVFASGRAGIPESFYLGENRVFNLIPLWRMRTGSRFAIERPVEADIPEMAGLLRKYTAGFRLAPHMDEARFRDMLGSIGGIGHENFWVARENGRIRAMTALWDEHEYMSYQVLKLSTGISVVNGLLRALSPVMKVPHPVRLNEPLRRLSLVFYAHDGCPEALGTLFRHVNNALRGQDYTLITLYAQARDPMFGLLRRFPGVSVGSEMYLFAKNPSLYESLRSDGRGDLLDLTLTI
jgi:predicted N-acetyltransferase YhbS